MIYTAYVSAGISHIDFDTVMSGMQKEKGGGIGFVTALLLKLSTFSHSLDRFYWLIEKWTVRKAREFGVSLDWFEIKRKMSEIKSLGGCAVYTFSVSLDVDYAKLVDVLSQTKKEAKNGKNDMMQEILRIVKPFAAKTIETIPPSAVAELFDLLVRDKLVELAAEYGAKVSNISLAAE